jgi:HK97 family phage major capsid protein
MKHGRLLTAALAMLCLVLAGVALFDPTPASAAALDMAGTFRPADWSLSLLGALGGTIALADLKQKRAKAMEELEELAKGELTEETRKRFDELEGQVRTLDEDIQRAERLDAVRRSAAAAQAPAPQPGTTQAQDPVERRAGAVPAQVAERRDLGWEFGAFVRSYAQSQFAFRSEGRIVAPGQIAKDLYGERHPVTEAVQRAQTLNDNAGGGFLVAPTYASEIIRLFGPNTIVRRRGQVVPGNASYLKGKTGATVGYVGENEQGQVTGVTFGLIDMTEKDISAILPISQKLLRNANTIGLESYCRDELIRAAAEFEDRKFLYGNGVGKEVKGYANAIPAAQKFAATSSTTPTNAQVRADLRKILKALADANVPVDGNEPAWFLNPAVKMYLEDLYQGDLKAFPTLEGPNPTLLGYPVATTTQITGPAGAGGDIFFGAHRYAMIGDSVTMRLSTSDQASFKDASGQQVNMWAQGMMAIKLDMSHDFALRYEQAFGMLTGVKWGG